MWSWDDVNVADVRRRAGLTEARTTADDEYDDVRRMPNPLFKVSASQLSDHFERAEELDRAMIRIGLGGKEPTTGQEHMKGLALGRRKFTQLARLPIASLLSTEPKLEKEHIEALVRGDDVKESSFMPIIFRLNDGDWIVDGNHRVVAAHLKGEKEVPVELLDLRQLEAELFS